MIVEELVSVLGLEVGAGALGVLEEFKETVHHGLGAIAAIGGIATGAFLELIHSTAEAGIQIAVTSEKLGVATDVLQELKYAADQSDVSFESLTVGLKFLSKNATEAAEGSAEAAKAFAGIALHGENGRLKTADELLLNIIEDFDKVKDPIKQTELAMKRFGRSGIDLVPLLKKGTKGVQEFMQEAKELGLVMDKEALEASENFNHGLKRLTGSLIGLRNILGTPFIEGLAEGMTHVAHVIRDMQPFIRQVAAGIKDAWERFKAIGEVVLDLGRRAKAALGDGGILGHILGAIDLLKVFEGLVIGLGVVLVATGISAAASWILALAPFLLIAAAIGLIIDDVVSWMDGNDSLIGNLLGGFDQVGGKLELAKDWLTEFWAALSDPEAWQAFAQNATEAVLGLVPKLNDGIGELFKVLADPKNWLTVLVAIGEFAGKVQEKLMSVASTILGTIGTFISAVLSGIVDGISAKFPVIGGLIGAGKSMFKATTGADVGDVAGAFNPIANLKNIADASFGGGAAGPEAAASFAPQATRMGPTIHLSQQNSYSIDAAGGDPEKLKKALREHDEDRNREAYSAMPLMSGG